MIRKTVGLLICLAVLMSASLALAGGAVQAPAPQPYGVRPYAQPYYGPGGGNPCAFWGDAPIPGMCGGIIALPFLVVGSLLGGNPAGPCGPAPSPRFNCLPRPGPPVRSSCPPGYGPYYSGAGVGGIPIFDLTSGLLGGITGGAGLL